MSGTQNKVLGKRSKNTNAPEIEVVALGNRKKPVPLINTSNLSSAGGKLMEYDEKINTPGGGQHTPNSEPGGMIKKQKLDVVQPPIFTPASSSPSPTSQSIPPSATTTTTIPPPIIPNMTPTSTSSGQPSPIRAPPIPPHLLQQQIQQRQQQQQQQQNHNNHNNNHPNHHQDGDSLSLIELINSIDNEKDSSKAIKLIKSIVTTMRSHLLTSNIPSNHLFNGDSDKSPYILFVQMVKRNTQLFQIPEVLDLLLGLYRRDPTQLAQPQSKKNILVQVFASLVLFAAYENVPDWPASFFYIYTDDAIGDRLWVDDINCKPFCQAIQSSLPNRQQQQQQQQHQQQLQQQQSSFKPSPPPQPTIITSPPPVTTTTTTIPTTTTTTTTMTDSDEEIEEEIISSSTTVMIQSSSSSSTSTPTPIPTIKQPTNSRFQHCHNEIVRYIQQTIKSFNVTINPRGLLRLLLLTVGFKESRAEGAQLIEQLLTNQTVFRAAKEYLQALLQNCSENSPEDIRAVQILMRVQVHSSISTDIIPTLLGNNPAYASIALRQAIELELELPGASGPGGSKGAGSSGAISGGVGGAKSRLSVIFKHMLPLRAEEELASILKELCVREDYTMKVVSRMVIRKIIKQFPSINMLHFCNQLVDISKDEQYLMKDNVTKERWAHNLVYAICQILLLIPGQSSQSQPSQQSQQTQQNERDMTMIRSQISIITDNTITWCTNLFNLFIHSPTDIIDMMKRILFLEPINIYFPTTMAIIDSDRVAYRILSNEIQIQENTINNLLGLVKENQNSVDKKSILELLDIILRRSVMINIKFYVPVHFGNGDTIGNDIFMLSEIGTIGKVSVANAQLFWQAVIIVCFIICLSPSTVGKVFWQSCPTIRTVLEMIVTRLWRFPPYVSKSTSQMQSLEQAAHAKELEIMAFLAGNQQSTGGPIIVIDLPGCARQPPNEVLERLQRLDNDLHMSYLLCQSRQPDFLLDIMSSQESRTSLQWLVQIIHTDPRTLDILPSICLAKVLLMADHASVAPIANKIVNRIGTLITNSPTSTLEFIKFFFTSLSSPLHQTRHQTRVAIASLPPLKQVANSPTTSSIFPGDHSNLYGSILRIPAQLPWFDHVSQTIYQSLLQALQVETDTFAIRTYLEYLSNYSQNTTTPKNNNIRQSLAINIGKIIMNRKIISRFLLNDSITKPIILDLFSDACQFYYTQDKIEDDVNVEDGDDVKVKDEKMEQEKEEEEEEEDKIIITRQDNSTISIPTILIHSIIYSICNIGGGGSDKDNQIIDGMLNKIFIGNKSYSKKILENREMAVEALQSNNQILIDMAIEQLDPPTLSNSLKSLAISKKSRQLILDKLAKEKIEESVRPSPSRDKQKTNGLVKKKSILSNYFNKSHEQLSSTQQQQTQLSKPEVITVTKKPRHLTPLPPSSSSSIDLKTIIRDTPTDLLEEILGKLFGRMYFDKHRTPHHQHTSQPNQFNLIKSLIESIEELPNNHSSLGLLLDWLAILINQIQPPQSLVKHVFNLMFGLPRRPFSTFLLSHFIHKSSWSTLSALIQYLLSPSVENEEKEEQDDIDIGNRRTCNDPIDEQSVLTFINAYHCHPRSSAPYYSTNHSQLIDSLLRHFTTSTICLFSNHISRAQACLDDSSRSSSSSTTSPSSSSSSSSSSTTTIKRSIVLLTSAAHISLNHLSTLAYHLSNNNYNNIKNNKIMKASQDILLQLYYSFPTTIKSLLPDYAPLITNLNNQVLLMNQQQQHHQQQQQQIDNNNKDIMPTTQLDIPIHRVILKIYEPNQRREAFILFQKLAYDHPELITIHLSSISALFAGKSYLALDQFIIKKYHILYCDILDIINLLGQCVFSSCHMDRIVEEYFSFLSNVRIQVDELVALVCKFMEFLPIYQKLKVEKQYHINNNNNNSNNNSNDIINKNMEHLELLSNLYPMSKQSFIKIQLNICCFHVLDTNIPTQQQHHQLNNNNMMMLQQQHHQQQQLQIQVNQDIEKLRIDLEDQINIGQQEKYIIKLIEDIGRIRRTVPGISGVLADTFLEILAQLINCNRDRIRLSAYGLLRELLLSSPTKTISDRIVHYYSATFYNPNVEVVRSALSHAGTMFLFANHSQQKLIERMLYYAGKESLPEIKRIILPFIKIYC